MAAAGTAIITGIKSYHEFTKASPDPTMGVIGGIVSACFAGITVIGGTKLISWY